MSASEHVTANDDLKQAVFRFGCGHEVRAIRRNIRNFPERCPECRRADRVAAYPAKRAARRKELAEQAKRLGPRPKATPEQRKAQRVLVALVQPPAGRMYLDVETGTLRFQEAHSSMGLPLADVAAMFDLLGIPAVVEVSKRGRKVTVELVVRRADRDALYRWTPALAAKVSEAESGR